MKVSIAIENFKNFVTAMQNRYKIDYENVNLCDKASQDLLHDLELGNCYDCCCHHDCVDCDMDDEEYVNVTLPKEDIETLHMLCRIFKV